MNKKLKSTIRTIKDYPKEGINFRDITTILQDKDTFKIAIDLMKKEIKNLDVDIIVGPEARGIMFASPLAYATNKGYVPVRKKGKLPSKTIQEEYDLEYGTDILEIHEDAIKKGQNVVIVDDLMATGGTMQAIINLVERLGGNVIKILCLVDLKDLKGRDKFKNYNYSYILEFTEDE